MCGNSVKTNMSNRWLPVRDQHPFKICMQHTHAHSQAAKEAVFLIVLTCASLICFLFVSSVYLVKQRAASRVRFRLSLRPLDGTELETLLDSEALALFWDTLTRWMPDTRLQVRCWNKRMGCFISNGTSLCVQFDDLVLFSTLKKCHSGLECSL